MHAMSPRRTSPELKYYDHDHDYTIIQVMNLESKTRRLEATQAVNPFDNELAYAQECYHEVESFGLF